VLENDLQLPDASRALPTDAVVDGAVVQPSRRPLVAGVGVSQDLEGLTGLREFGRPKAQSSGLNGRECLAIPVW
jgi:hypothetical protein